MLGRRLAVAFSVLVGSTSCGGSPAGPLLGSSAPIREAPPPSGAPFAPLPPPWRDLVAEAVVQPWHRFVLGGAPSFAAASFVAESPPGGGLDCHSLSGGAGTREMFFVDGRMRRGLVVVEYISAQNQAHARAFLDAGHALPNGWTEYESRTAPDVALFGRVGRPWVCATGEDIRSRVRATLATDDHVPPLAGLPRDVALVSIHTPCATGGCQQSISVFQTDDDVRERVARYGITRQASWVRVMRRDVYASPDQANKALAENLRYTQPECTFGVRGTDFLYTCRQRGSP